MKSNKLAEKDRMYVGRDEPALPLEIVKSDASFLYGPAGEKYIDFIMGWCVGNIGWGQKEVLKKIKNFKGPEYVDPNYLYKQWADLAELLVKITPGNLTKSFRATGGTEAVEIALQAAMAHTGRHKFLSIEGSYHGHSIGAMSVGSSSFRSYYKNLLPDCYKINLPLDEKAAREAEKILNRGDIAAFIAEPIICNLGVAVPDKEFFDIVFSACKRNGTVFIADEVATGFGRTGKMFASEHYNLNPDIMCLAKGITGGYGGLGATIMTDEVAKAMEFDFSYYSTFGWHPLNVEAAIANANFLLKNEEKIFSNIEKTSRYFRERLAAMKFKYSTDVRVKGLAIGIEFKNGGDYGLDIARKCLAKNLLFSALEPNIITFFPALTIDSKTAKTGLDIFEKCI